MITWTKWKEFLYSIVITKEWALFINIARFLTFVAIIIIAYMLYTEIEAVKLLGSDPCQVCNEMIEGWHCAYIG